MTETLKIHQTAMFRLGAKAKTDVSRDQDKADVKRYLAHGNAACATSLFGKWEQSEKNQHEQFAVVQGSLAKLGALRERVEMYTEATQETTEYFLDNDDTESSVHAPNYQHLMAMTCPKEFSREIANVLLDEEHSTHPESVIQRMVDRVTSVIKYTNDVMDLHKETHVLLVAAAKGASGADVCEYFKTEIRRRKKLEATKKRAIEQRKKKPDLPVIWTSPPKWGKGNVTRAALPPSPDHNDEEEEFDEDLSEMNIGGYEDEDEDEDDEIE